MGAMPLELSHLTYCAAKVRWTRESGLSCASRIVNRVRAALVIKGHDDVGRGDEA